MEENNGYNFITINDLIQQIEDINELQEINSFYSNAITEY